MRGHRAGVPAEKELVDSQVHAKDLFDRRDGAKAACQRAKKQARMAIRPARRVWQQQPQRHSHKNQAERGVYVDARSARKSGLEPFDVKDPAAQNHAAQNDRRNARRIAIQPQAREAPPSRIEHRRFVHFNGPKGIDKENKTTGDPDGDWKGSFSLAEPTLNARALAARRAQSHTDSIGAASPGGCVLARPNVIDRCIGNELVQFRGNRLFGRGGIARGN